MCEVMHEVLNAAKKQEHVFTKIKKVTSVLNYPFCNVPFFLSEVERQRWWGRGVACQLPEFMPTYSISSPPPGSKAEGLGTQDLQLCHLGITSLTF